MQPSAVQELIGAGIACVLVTFSAWALPDLWRATGKPLGPTEDELLAARAEWQARLRDAETERLRRMAWYELGWAGKSRRPLLCWERSLMQRRERREEQVKRFAELAGIRH